MKNNRITVKERNLLKGAIRRVFSRSELRNKVIDASIIKGYSNPERPRVKTWCKCSDCKEPTPKSYMQADHILPVVPLDRTFADMSIDELVDNLWCDENNLQAICETCHDKKTALERKERRKLKNNERKR